MFPLQGGMPTAITYSDDVFSAYTYTGNGSTQTITNGINLSGKGGLVWMKGRNNTTAHALYDTVRGATFDLAVDTTAAATTQTTGLTAFNSNGFALGTLSKLNSNTATYASWTFRKAPKFFDIVTYTGNGATNAQSIAHNLEIAPGLIIIKRLNSTSNWFVYHRSQGDDKVLRLNTTELASTISFTNWTATSSVFGPPSISGSADANVSGGTYVAYLFAHDTTTDGNIQCGTFTTDAVGDATVNLGWEPQFLIVKNVTATSDWWIFDTTRNWVDRVSGSGVLNTTIGIDGSWGGVNSPTATGFKINISASANFIYIAVRRSNKPPTAGTQVLQAVAYTGNSDVQTITTSTLVAPDLFWAKWRAGTPGNSSHNIWDRLRGVASGRLFSNLNNAEGSGSAITSFNMNGVTLNSNFANTSSTTYIGWLFKRARGVFDQVCYSGTNAARVITHNLGVVPELIIVKNRTTSTDWAVYSAPVGKDNALFLHLTNAFGAVAHWDNTLPTSTGFSLTTNAVVNQNGSNYLAWIFASSAGISKVGSYTGNGTLQTINCNFVAGARFVLIKSISSGGNWYVWDTTRGIIAANDPYLILNGTDAEITTDDSIDPVATGFIVNQLATTNINVNTATYLFLAIA